MGLSGNLDAEELLSIVNKPHLQVCFIRKQIHSVYSIHSVYTNGLRSEAFQKYVFMYFIFKALDPFSSFDFKTSFSAFGLSFFYFSSLQSTLY